MKIGRKTVKIFKMANRTGYCAICGNCVTEGRTSTQAYSRMVKAVSRVERLGKK